MYHSYLTLEYPVSVALAIQQTLGSILNPLLGFMPWLLAEE